MRTPPEMTCGFVIQLVFCKKRKAIWFIGVTAIGFRTESEPSMNHDESTNMATFNDGPIRKN